MIEYYERINLDYLKRYCTKEEYEQLEELVTLASLMGYDTYISYKIMDRDPMVDIHIKGLVLRFHLNNFDKTKKLYYLVILKK